MESNTPKPTCYALRCFTYDYHEFEEVHAVSFDPELLRAYLADPELLRAYLAALDCIWADCPLVDCAEHEENSRLEQPTRPHPLDYFADRIPTK